MVRKVLAKTKGFVCPGDPIFYLICKKSKRLCSFLVKKNFAFEATVEVTQVPDLEEQEEELTWKLPPLPACTIQQFLEFFRRVRLQHNSEALLLMFYSPELEKFALLAPEQENTPMNVAALENLPAPEGYYLVGTIHSHPSHSFHSEIDMEDEFNSADGLHIVVGNLTSPAPEYTCTVVINGRRFKIEPSKALELPKVSPEWLEKVHPKSHFSRGYQA